jgi:hypothetical protein
MKSYLLRKSEMSETGKGTIKVEDHGVVIKNWATLTSAAGKMRRIKSPVSNSQRIVNMERTHEIMLTRAKVLM